MSLRSVLRGPAERYALTTAKRDTCTISEICPALAFPKNGFLSRRHTRANGSPRMTRELHDLCHVCSRGRVARLMRRHGARKPIPANPIAPRDGIFDSKAVAGLAIFHRSTPHSPLSIPPTPTNANSTLVLDF
jgi:hypothetical protein